MFSKLTVLLVAGTLIGLPTLAAYNGWGLGTERNPSVVKAVQSSEIYCPAHRRDAFGNCRRGYRSYYYGRSTTGGSFGRGK